MQHDSVATIVVLVRAVGNIICWRGATLMAFKFSGSQITCVVEFHLKQWLFCRNVRRRWRRKENRVLTTLWKTFSCLSLSLSLSLPLSLFLSLSLYNSPLSLTLSLTHTHFHCSRLLPFAVSVRLSRCWLKNNDIWPPTTNPLISLTNRNKLRHVPKPAI